MRLLMLVLCACALSCADAAKILVMFPMPSKSHTLLGAAMSRILADDGHDVTYVTAFPMENKPSNVREVDISSLLALIPKGFTIKSIIDGQFSTDSVVQQFFMFHFIMKGVITHENVQSLINDPNEKFDLVINEFMFNSMTSGLAAVFQCPLIWFTPIQAWSAVTRLFGEGSNPAYIPEPNYKYLPPYSFTQRAAQLWTAVKTMTLHVLFGTFLDGPAYNAAFSKAAEVRGIPLKPLAEAELSASLLLSNSHPSLGTAVAAPESTKVVGGFHIKNETKPLPADLKKIMDEAKHGVIYFSMGSNLKSKDLPDEIKMGLLKTFGSLKETVLWKFEEVLPGTPKNVHILQWAPQHSILAHPNCKLFITHGGFLSTTETVHFGVPIIGVPAFADQFTNIHRAEIKGFAKEVNLNYQLPENLKVAIEEITSNPSYTQKVKMLSKIYHDRIVPPAKELLHWVNHVLKTDGAPHLQSPALGVPLYQRLFLDIMAVGLAILWVLWKILGVVRRLFGKKKVKTN